MLEEEPMRKIIGTFICLSMLSACGANPGASGKLGANIALYNPDDISQMVKMQMIDKKDVLDSLQMMQKSFATSYIGYNLKKELIGKSGDEIFAKCIDSAKNGPEKVATYQLYDYVLECIAGFKDTHLSIEKLLVPAWVATAISSSAYIDGKIYINGVRLNLLKKIEEVQKLEPSSLSKKLATGYEIVSIDGEPSLLALKKLQKFIGKSSDDYADTSAAESLFTRKFSYPEKKEVSLTIKDSEGNTSEVVLPWVQYTAKADSLESRSLLASKGILAMSKMFGEDKDLMDGKEFNFADPLFADLSAKRTFLDEEEEPAMVLGLKTVNNKTSCYMQLNTFELNHNSDLGYKLIETLNEKNQIVSFDENVKNFLKSCQMFKAPLILDVRANGGGDPTLAEVLYEYLETPETPQTYRVVNLLNNSGNLVFLDGVLDRTDKEKDNLEGLLTFQALKNSFEKKAPVSDWIAMKTTHERGVFTGPVTLLISPACVSACDGFSNRMKLSGRARLLGKHSNGTGFGFANERKSTYQFQDQLRLYTARMPNRSFQNILVPSDKDYSVEGDLKGAVIAREKIEIIENKPTQPDTIIEYTLKDLTKNFSDYNAKLSSLLETAAPN